MAAMQTVDFNIVRAAYAKKVNKDDATAAKQLRARLRSNFDTLAAAYPTHYGAKGSIKEHANDRRPWGALPVSFVNDVLKLTVKG